MKQIFFLFLLITCSTILQAVVIIVHGTFATESDWCHPQGKFYRILERQAHIRGEVLVPFNWSGKLSNASRIKAAESLAKVILSYAKDKITLIGFSHGGNVINLASKLLSKHEQAPLVHLSELTGFLQAYKNIQKMKVNTYKKKYLIDAVYLIATPIDIIHYAPHMGVIENIYNFYSKSDMVQPILGFYDRHLTSIERAINFRVILNTGMEEINPSHEQMHNCMIAHWLLSIPHELKEANRGNFQECTINSDGIIYFYRHKEPRYQVIS